MTAIRLAWHEYPPADCTGGAVTFGNFDGVHLGHRALIDAAKRAGRPAVVVTFDPPPLAILHPTAVKPPLSTTDDKVKWALQAGADRVITLVTDPALLSLSPEAFFEDIILRQFQAKAIIEGVDFRFGRRREGDRLLLERLAREAGIVCQIVPPVEFEGEAVSSSRVRQGLTSGQVRQATSLLARPYSITGLVVHGAKRGRTIGFPTANLDRVPTLVPGVGVYAGQVEIDGRTFAAAANVGPNPTFGEDERKIEIHVIDFSDDLYGRTLTLEFLHRIRDTQPFASVDELKARLQLDIAAARQIVAGGS